MDGTSSPTNPPAHGAQAQYYNDAAALYADPQIRLHYPPELFQRVYAFAGPVTDAALDVATGTGQCARQLASRYQQVGVSGNLSMMQPGSVAQSAALYPPRWLPWMWPQALGNALASWPLGTKRPVFGSRPLVKAWQSSWSLGKPAATESVGREPLRAAIDGVALQHCRGEHLFCTCVLIFLAGLVLSSLTARCSRCRVQAYEHCRMLCSNSSHSCRSGLWRPARSSSSTARPTQTSHSARAAQRALACPHTAWTS